MNTLFVFDIDGTLADATRRFAKAGHEPSRGDKAAYLRWLDEVQNKDALLEDAQVRGMRDLVQGASKMGQIVYVTSREEKYRGVTLLWLHRNGFPSPHLLYMRGADDWRSSGDLKEAIIKVLAIPYERGSWGTGVIIVDDDPRGDVQEMAHRNGWTFLKATSGGKG
jgi:FMN phosphatase YigB (HAD superfamily)